MTPPVVLTIAGSDSSGGAGIQADLRTFAAIGVLGASAVTCLTAQNTLEVRDIWPVPASFVRRQVEAVVGDIALSGAKTGLLGDAAMVKEVAGMAPDLPALVVDPVMSSSTGRCFIDDAALRAYREHLLACAAVVTPNLVEAAALVGRELRSLEDARSAARQLGELAPFVVVKGGHIEGAEACTDVVWDGKSCWEMANPRLKTANTHGSGCTFSAAVAAGLALGMQVAEAVRLANQFVYKAIQGSMGWRVGAGFGPLDYSTDYSRRRDDN